MPLAAIGLVLTSCALHAYWNLLYKRAGDKLAFTALFLLVTPLLYLPMFAALIGKAVIPALGWLCILSTGVVYFGYFVGLSRAYEQGDLSVVYPLARSVGPALTLLWGVLLLGERPTGAGVGGIVLILCGVVLIHQPWERTSKSKSKSTSTIGPARTLTPTRTLTRREAFPVRSLFTSPATLSACFVGLMYSFYSLIDKLGVGRLRLDPALYIYLTFTTTALLVVPWIIWRRGAASLRAEWGVNRWACIAVGGLNLLAYLLVLYALSLPNTPVSYIVPLRTLSVLFGVWLGVEVLREEGKWSKLGAALVMVAGVLLITWKG
jgi:drug/metabolite transporter (DMT)-like permease